MDNEKNVYVPDLNAHNPSEQHKVEILESTVMHGTLDDLKAVLEKYKPFEMTARALGLAARYRGIDFVRMLADHGATFKYKKSSDFGNRYNTQQGTVTGFYRTEYYLMLVSDTDGEKMKYDLEDCYDRYEHYYYSPLYGIMEMYIPENLKNKVLPLTQRIEIFKYFIKNPKLEVSADGMLYWAVISGEIEFADALIDMGINLDSGSPTYFSRKKDETTYIDMLSTSEYSMYRDDYTRWLSDLNQEKLLPVLQRLDKLVRAAGEQVLLTQSLFYDLEWNDDSLAFAIKNLNISKINQKKALELAVSHNFIAALAVMADIGWLKQSAKREAVIKYAQDNNKTESLAWLMDFKNRTVDVAAESAKAEAKALRELSTDPNSVTALKKIWNYKKLDDGSLVITSYKGDATKITVPGQIGKGTVISIGEYAFGVSPFKKCSNSEVRKNIISVTIPESVTRIEKEAFCNCKSLVSVDLPSGLEYIGLYAFANCKNLKNITIPKTVKEIAYGAFNGCCNLQ